MTRDPVVQARTTEVIEEAELICTAIADGSLPEAVVGRFAAGTDFSVKQAAPTDAVAIR